MQMFLSACKPAATVGKQNKLPSTLFNIELVHQSVSRLLPGMSHVMGLCCNAAIPGIPPWNAQIGPHRMGPRLENKTTFLRQVLTKNTVCLILCNVSSTWMGDVMGAYRTKSMYRSYEQVSICLFLLNFF